MVPKALTGVAEEGSIIFDYANNQISQGLSLSQEQ
jgi:hypothetical protein